MAQSLTDKNESQPILLQRKTKLNTNGCCFLCLKVINIKTEKFCSNSEVESTAKNELSSTVSLKIISRCFKINTKRLPGSSAVFAEAGPNSWSISTLNEDAEAIICNSCSRIINKLSETWLQLEKVQMEMKYWMKEAQQQISDALMNPELVQNYSKVMTSDAEALTHLPFVDAFRKEIVKKCSKLDTRRELKIKLSPLNREKVFQNRNNFNSSIETEREITSTSSPIFSSSSSVAEDDYVQEEVKVKQDDIIDDGCDTISEPSLVSPPEFNNSKITIDDLKPQNVTLKATKPARLRRGTKSFFNRKTNKHNCTLCSQEYLSKAGVIYHYDLVHLRKQQKCNICNISVFKYPTDLTKHQKTCRKTLQSRLDKKVALEKLKFGCKTCGKKYSDKYTLAKHQSQVHQGERFFSCDLCDKKFTTVGNFREHKAIIHFGRKLYCKFCKKQFNYQKSKKQHEVKCAGTEKIKLENE